MKFLFLSVGKPHEAYVSRGVEDFTQRINRYYPVQWQLIPPPKNAAALPDNELKKQEAIQIVGVIQATDFLVLLDERGKQFSSIELADLIQQKAVSSTRRIVFLIGGAYGVDERLLKQAGLTWSLSKLVFPHMLVRLILAEQVYRACTISRNEQYHHG
ncbi:MAG: 23S rRNA (pseudouridine(1915)-N(3))-methyltransferase RlmH [Chitinophagaceae bacterium]|nr:23S rRNA (pseudouridine(1915)-N(3))-methyltransferase RlmH [Chitinophagaceae bacterium]MCW5926369.1 23S rRNA (pseudouridine(1915)-N(3))-methyltransferase RlmH [Chitinophagaceae bacterium]